MESSTIANPELLSKIIASQTTLVNPIPSDATGTSAASQAEGFPAITMEDKSAGGIAPDGKDFNGFLKLLSSHIFNLQVGEEYTFNQDVSNAIGGYPLGALLWYKTNTQTYLLRSTIENNTDNFNTDPSVVGTSWVYQSTDNDLSNLSNAGKYTISNLSMPDYSAGISVTTPFTPTRDGYLIISCRAGNFGVVSLLVNGNIIDNYHNNTAATDILGHLRGFVPANQPVTISGGLSTIYTGAFYPLVGENNG